MFNVRPHILITNDDGVHADGIKHLWNALHPYADLTVVAPALEQSGVALATTIRSPLIIERIKWKQEGAIWSVSGTPADCVKMALHAIVDRKPDLVVAGINRGSNAGRTVLYSGTVGAAIEGVMQGIPSVAFSARDYTDPDYLRTEKYIPWIIKHVIECPLPCGTLLNVNFPEKRLGEIKGFKMTQQGHEYWEENPSRHTHPAEGNAYYWLGSRLKQVPPNENSDFAWLDQGYATAVPIHIAELTDKTHLERSRNHFENSFPQ